MPWKLLILSYNYIKIIYNYITIYNYTKLALGGYENTSALINIAQEDDSNSFELLQNFWINNLRFIILKCSRFWFLFLFYFYCIPTSLLFQSSRLLGFDIFSNHPYDLLFHAPLSSPSIRDLRILSNLTKINFVPIWLSADVKFELSKLHSSKKTVWWDYDVIDI